MENKYLGTVVLSPLLLQDHNTWLVCSSHIILTGCISLCHFTERHFCNYRFISVSILNILYYKNIWPKYKLKAAVVFPRWFFQQSITEKEKKSQSFFRAKVKFFGFRLFPNFRSSTLKIQSLNKITVLAQKRTLCQTDFYYFLISFQYSALYFWTLTDNFRIQCIQRTRSNEQKI